MKALLVLVVILAGVLWWRSRQTPSPPQAPPKTPGEPLDMVRCTRCGMHIPGNEAIHGHHGSYCSQEHLRQSEP
ncbi:hypothetical protein MIZ03_3984 [Rhodoferax lithotrophicus]|uniref:Uncharacterized protein n=1 Tax=Rhodoferax lithotrophicus TaxID=2798804 RepID=A0ABN6DAN8_9BURK|nr:PP0621 family protein [Rhodoferax sp. MIZ03]BCO29072.1 hypothetical protein MIZ03_3984 [Rhodoferax sp. MIZ03]